jgi:AcrR family transcriptional regulator
MSLSSDEPAAPGRRESRKSQVRLALQAQALRLFGDNGYDRTTVADIASAAGVSERTYFRYFATKADAVTWDYIDDRVIAAFRAQPAEITSVEAFRRALRASLAGFTNDELGDQTQRRRLMNSVPELRSASLSQLWASIDAMEDLLLERTGRANGDASVRALAGAIVGIGVSMAATAQDGDLAPARITATYDRALRYLDQGFAGL